MRRFATIALAVAALASAAGPATAGGGGGFAQDVVIGISGGHAVYAELDVRGSVTVDFHGDQATGCAQAHLCDVTGTVRWDPSGSGTLLAFAYREHGKRFEEGFLTLGDEGAGGSSVLATARVSREGVPGSLCADSAGLADAASAFGPSRGSALPLRLVDVRGAQDFLRTRCAGPMAVDVAALLPARRISERELTRGHRTLDFSADRPFSAHGLAGRVRSTVVLKVAHAERVSNADSGSSPRGTRKVRRRVLDVAYRVERVSGAVVTRVNGLRDPDECGPLDACGLQGSITLSHRSASGRASLYAVASARHSRADLRRALGLAPGARPRGVQKYGAIDWNRDRGSLSSDLSRNGAPACADSTPVPGRGASLELDLFRRRVTVAYLADPFGGGDLLRTRCPGPGSSDAAGSLARANYPLSVFRHRRITLHLTRGTRLTGVGYAGRTRPDVTIVLRRTRIHEYTYSEDLSPDYPGETVRPIH